MSTRKMTDTQREAKRERDRKYRAKKRAEKATHKGDTVKAKNLKLKVKLDGKKAHCKCGKGRPLPNDAMSRARIRAALFAIGAVFKYLAVGI